MSWIEGTENRKRNTRIAKKVAKYRASRKGYVAVLGAALYYPLLSKEQVRQLKVEARKLARMCHTRMVFEHLAIHKRYNYDTVKLRIRKPNDKPIPNIYTTLYSKLVARKDVEFWKTQLDVVEVVEKVNAH